MLFEVTSLCAPLWSQIDTRAASNQLTKFTGLSPMFVFTEYLLPKRAPKLKLIFPRASVPMLMLWTELGLAPSGSTKFRNSAHWAFGNSSVMI